MTTRVAWSSAAAWRLYSSASSVMDRAGRRNTARPGGARGHGSCCSAAPRCTSPTMECTPEAPRSQVWSVKGHKNTDDVYLGLRDRMDLVKLSFHRGTWRLAYTLEAASQVVPDGEDRKIQDWMP